MMSEQIARRRVSRRTFLQAVGVGAAATVGASLVSPLPVRGQSNPSLAREAGVYRFRVGTINLTVINDGVVNLPAPVLAVNAPEGVLADLLAANYLPTDVFVAPAHVMLVETGDRRVLIDTGLGDVALPGSEPNSGKLAPTLALLGIDPASIDTVVISHIHPDHIGGIVTDSGQAAFPNATHYVPQADLDFWLPLPTDTPDDFANFFASVAQQKLPIIERQIEPMSGETEIAPGVTALPAPGHTPGHYVVRISSEGEHLLNLADTALHHIIGMQQPGWYLGLEVDPVTAESTRRDLLQQASDERFKVFGYHFPFPGVGYAVRDAAEERWEFVVTG